MLPLRDINPVRVRPVVMWAIIAANVAVFLLFQPAAFKGGMSPRDAQDPTEFLYEYAMVPCELSHFERLDADLVRECGGELAGPPSARALFPEKNVFLSVLYSMFFHANFLHIAGNMFFLWIFADNVEERFGRIGFLFFYLAGGVIAAVGHVVSDPDSLVPVVGASGAVAAVMGAYLVQSPRATLTTIIPPLFFLPFRIPAFIFLIEWLVLQFFTSANSGIAWIAHVAGFAGGVVLALVWRPRRRPPAGLARMGQR